MKNRNIGDLVTPVDEIQDKDNSTKVEHQFKKGQRLVIDRVSPFESKDGTKNYWCEDEHGVQQMMNEKEIIPYE